MVPMPIWIGQPRTPTAGRSRKDHTITSINEHLQINYKVLRPATKHPDDATGQTVNWNTLQ